MDSRSLSLLLQMHANYSSMSKKLHKIQCCLSRMSRGSPPIDMQDSVVEYASDSAPTVFIGETDSALVDENSNPMDNSEVLIELVNSSGNSSNSIQFPTVVASLGCLGTSSTQLETKYDAEENSKVYACKVFTEIPVREIDMEVEDSVEYDLQNPESQVFDEMFHTVSVVKCDSSDLVKPNEILLARPYMFSACSHDQFIGGGTFAFLNELNHATLILSLHRFPPNQFRLYFPFDPGSSLFTSFLDVARYCSTVVVNDFKEIIRIVECDVGSTSNDRYILTPFPFDPEANLFIVTPGGCLHVPQLQPGSSAHTLLLVKLYTFQLFRALSYILKLGCDVCLVSSQIIDAGRDIRIVLEGLKVVKFVISSHDMRLASNACAIAFVASDHGVLDIALASKSLSRFILVHRRLDLEVAENGMTRIPAVYNASPASIDCKSKRVAILRDMLELGPSEFTFHGLMLQKCLNPHLNVVANVGPRFLTTTEIVDCFEEIKLVCSNDSHCMASKIIDYLLRGDIILANDSSERQLGVTLDLVKLIFPTAICCSMVREDASTESSSLSLNFWKMRFIHAHILGSSYISNIRQAALNGFLISNMSLMTMEGAMILCGQQALLKNPEIILLIESTTTLVVDLHRSVQEAQVMYDPLHGKMLACCLMICADILPKVVNVASATISCHFDTVMIDHIFSYHIDYLCIDTIGGTSATNIVFNANLEDKVLIEEGGIVMNEIGQKTNQFGILENFVWDPGKKTKVKGLLKRESML